MCKDRFNLGGDVKNSERKQLFINYMENVNYIEDDSKEKRLKRHKIEKWIGNIILSCIAIMTAWEILKEVIVKLRF